MAHSEGFIPCFTSARGQLKGGEHHFGKKGHQKLPFSIGLH